MEILLSAYSMLVALCIFTGPAVELGKQGSPQPQILAELEAKCVPSNDLAFPLRYQDLLTALLHITYVHTMYIALHLSNCKDC